ncbi:MULTISPECIES: NAD(P)-binding domain-containing protein [Xanthomonas]|uniref:NAD(P)-binding domain-containing protein n=1 Tax=Xanthomonas euroxanthea TaxID=2259622 RepID=UPI001ABB11BC
MKIGILGAGSIGTTLARKLAAAGHFVKVANSRAPETVDLAPSRASGSRTSSAGPLSKHGTPSLRRLLPSAADHRDIPDASPSLSPPTVPVTGKWQWHW